MLFKSCTDKSSTDNIIDVLAQTYCANADAETVFRFRQSLQELVTTAKTEQFLEMQIETIRLGADVPRSIC